MARSDDCYTGSWGETRTEAVHWSCACGFLFPVAIQRAVNASRDPELAAQLRAGMLGRVTCPSCGRADTVEVPVVYHDEAQRRFVLVLPPALRHRELEERAELLLALARDRGHAVPRYVVEFTVLFGVAALDAWLDGGMRAQVLEDIAAELPPTTTARAGATPIGELEDSTNRVGRTPPTARDAAVAAWIAARTPSAHLVEDGVVRLLVKLGGRGAGVLAGSLGVRFQLHRMASYPLMVVAIGGGDDAEPMAAFLDIERPEDRQALALLGQSFHVVVDFFDDGHAPVARREVILPLAANVRYALALADEQLAELPPARRSFEAAVQAWRAPGYDRFGRRDPRLDEETFADLPTPAAALQALSVAAGWSEPANEEYLLCIRSFPVDWWRRIRARVVARAVELGLVLPGPLLELALAERGRGRRELAARLLAAFADLCARPEENDLAPEQIAANWRALFTLCDEDGVGVDARVAEVARQTPGVRPPLVVVQPRRDDSPSLDELVAAAASVSSSAPVVRPAGRSAREETNRILVEGEDGSGRAPPLRPDYKLATGTELLELLDDKDLRLGAALELVRRGDPHSVGPVFGSIRRMTRGEAGRALPAVIGFGERAVPHLVDGLRSRKAYLRQGCALALGVLKSADGIDPLVELLASEPTEVWKEVARALGEIGGGAVMSLAARLREPGGDAVDVGERTAWALAHVAAKGGRAPVETLAGGRDPIAAAAARHGLELAGLARANDAEVRGPEPPTDVTVNRAFSRVFFEAMNEAPRPAADETVPGEEYLDADAEIIDEEDILPG
jgi:hypothetical protein